MPILGNVALVVAFAAALFTVLTGAIGGHLGSRRYAEVSRQALFVTAGAVLMASAALLYGFITHDYSLVYVHGRSETRMPMQYIIAAFWGGQEGSLLFWIAVTASFGAGAAFVNRARIPAVMPYFHAVLGGVLLGLLSILLFVTNPFVQFQVMNTPLDGTGLNPLLQNPLMVIHPPCLLAGFATFAVPYAFGMAALLARETSADWLRATRKWTLISWLFLSVGNILGGMWAYQELGWGGYWAWDPVENAALIPWFMATAYLHSVIIQEQRGMFRKWNAILVASTFILTILGTWLTRSGLIESVHTFAESEIGDYFFALLVTSIVFSAAVIGGRWKYLQSDHHIDSPVSREGAFLLNNWAFVGCAFIVLWGTLFPKFKEMVTGDAVAIGPAWFNRFTVPLGLILLLLMFLGTLLPWRQVTLRALRRNFTMPTLVTLVTVPIALFTWWQYRGQPLGMQPFGTAAAFAITGITLITYNAVTISAEFIRGTRARMRATGEGPVAALGDLLSRHRRRYGGYVVHLGMIMIFLAFCGNAAKVERDVTMRVGDTITLGDYTIRFDAVRTVDDRDKRQIIGDMTLSRGGRDVAMLRPARYDFNDYAALAGGNADPLKITSEIFIRSTPLEDVYVALLQVGEDDQSAAFKLVVLPFTWWFWFGGVVLVAGTLICMWPEPDKLAKEYWRHRALRRLEVAALTLTLMVPTVLFTHQMEAWAEAIPDVDRAQVRLVNEAFTMVMTTCTGCAGKSLATASPSCYASNEDKARIRGMAAEGASLDEILGVFVAERGERALAVPPSHGINRLAWAVPASGITLGMFVIVVFARRWSRTRVVGGPAAAANREGVAQSHEDDPYLSQLSDELAARG